MNSSPDKNNQLDTFISESLKNIHVESSSVSWGEVEVLLDNKQKNFAITLPGKKLIFAVIVLVVFAGAITIFVLLWQSSSNPMEPSPKKNVTIITPNIKVISQPSVSAQTTLIKDSTSNSSDTIKNLNDVLNKGINTKYEAHRDSNKRSNGKEERSHKNTSHKSDSLDSIITEKSFSNDTAAETDRSKTKKEKKDKKESKVTTEDSSSGTSFWKRITGKKAKHKSEEPTEPAQEHTDTIK